MEARVLKILVDGPLRGERNMAVDSWLMARVAATGDPVLRFYQWARPTLSLGYFQRAQDVSPLSWPDPEVDLCRRPTGGGAILHHLELTFSLILPQGHAWLRGSATDSYMAVCRPLVEVLRGLGVDAGYRGDAGCAGPKAANCFAGSACADIVVEGRKIAGAAQRRRGGAVLTHGSLLLRQDRKIWQRVFGEHLGEGFAALAEWIQVPEVSTLARQLAGRWAAALDLEGEPLILDAGAAGEFGAMESAFLGQSRPQKTA